MEKTCMRVGNGKQLLILGVALVIYLCNMYKKQCTADKTPNTLSLSYAIHLHTFEWNLHLNVVHL